MRPRFRDRLPLLIILAGGAALRLFRLAADSLWYDETVSTLLAGSPLPELIRHTAGDIHPPLYYILLRGWLIALGYPTGHADGAGNGLEFAAAFFSLFFGVLLIGLTYVLARRFADARAGLIAAALVALSPYHVWYSQEVRMYTLGAVLGVVATLALAEGVKRETSSVKRQTSNVGWWWAVYAVAAAAGMYTLYYFAFLLIALNLWALAQISKSRFTFYASRLTLHVSHLLLANLAAALLYAPWISIAWRQATEPPVPPWRLAPGFLSALVESWNALALGQSAPAWTWPAALAMLGVYVAGLLALRNRPIGQSANDVSRLTFDVSRFTFPVPLLPIATFGPLLLILLISLLTPLYHVRYVFTYSPAFYVVAGAGMAWLWPSPRREPATGPAAKGGGWRRLATAALAAGWLAAAGASLYTFWFDPWYRPDDHRAAVRALQARWRPGDVLLVNAGYVYPPLLTYWQGPVAVRSRLTAPLPAPRTDEALVIVMTGHLADALAPGQRLGWDDPRSDFFAMPPADADRQITALFQTFGRVWHYRVYDTVNDPAGRLRAQLADGGYLFEDLPFAGEANMRLQGFLPRGGAVWSADRPTARYPNGARVQFDDAPVAISAGETLHAGLTWRGDAPISAPFGVSLRLVGEDGATWAQPTDEKPFGPLFLPPQWPAGLPLRQPVRVPIPPGTPPGAYTLALLIYDPLTGAALPPQEGAGQGSAVPGGLDLRRVTVARGAATPRPALARFGPLALIEATSAATVVSPGDVVPVELLWQATAAAGEPLVVVVQLLAAGDRLIANLEEQPVGGRYGTQRWTADELVRDRHALQVPKDAPAGTYRLIVGLYRAADRTRFKTRVGLFGESDYWTIKHLTIR